MLAVAALAGAAVLSLVDAHSQRAPVQYVWARRGLVVSGAVAAVAAAAATLWARLGAAGTPTAARVVIATDAAVVVLVGAATWRWQRGWEHPVSTLGLTVGPVAAALLALALWLGRPHATARPVAT